MTSAGEIPKTDKNKASIRSLFCMNLHHRSLGKMVAGGRCSHSCFPLIKAEARLRRRASRCAWVCGKICPPFVRMAATESGQVFHHMELGLAGKAQTRNQFMIRDQGEVHTCRTF